MSLSRVESLIPQKIVVGENPPNRVGFVWLRSPVSRSSALPETAYTLPVWTDTRIRHYHRTQAGRVVEFVVQLEVEVRHAWKPVIRYDTAHGYAHIDRYNLRGRTKKDRLSLDFSEALSRAERDIKQNWSVYRERFLKGEWP